MATLTKTRSAETEGDERHVLIDLTETIPTPFPLEAIREGHQQASAVSIDAVSGQEYTQEYPVDSAATAREEQDAHKHAQMEAIPSISVLQGSSNLDDVHNSAQREVIPSISALQRSSITTLNDLLSGSSSWLPHTANRQSIPSSAEATRQALISLVTHLRQSAASIDMAERPSPDISNAQLLRELEHGVSALAPTLPAEDAALAHTLVSLLQRFDRLASVDSTVSTPHATPAPYDHAHENGAADADGFNPFDTLTRQVNSLQFERSTSPPADGVLPPMAQVQSALLWSDIEQDLEAVLDICRARRPAAPEDHRLPPEYTYPEEPPEYDAPAEKRDPLASTSTLGEHSEKMRMDLENVTRAIDRLYAVCPQLHSQRVELRGDKRARMERARDEPPALPKTKGKADDDKDIKDLQHMFDLLGRASERKLVDQSVVLDSSGMQAKLEKAQERDNQRKQVFVDQLAQHSETRRLHDQDAAPGTRDKGKARDPHAMLSLPEFMREALPPAVQRTLDDDPDALLTLPEFMRQAAAAPPPPPTHRPRYKSLSTSSFSSRSRSLSAPPLAWLLSSHSRPATAPGEDAATAREKRKSFARHKGNRPKSSDGKSVGRITPPLPASRSQAGLEITYVAEHHESLQHVLVFAHVTGVLPGQNVTAEVLPSSAASATHDGTQHERLVFRCGARTSPPLALPVPVQPGRKDVLVQSTHFEIKLATYDEPAPGSLGEAERPPLLDAAQLAGAEPSAFICTSCSLPLVARVAAYRDLPSEHWAELVDAWMCHSSQTVSEQVARHGRGVAPGPGEALVGGSYVLFEEGALVKTNLLAAEEPKEGEDWRLVRCLCGAVAGRCKDQQRDDGRTVTYRLAKYAIRPVSAKTDLSRVPLSAFIVEDMVELVQAHATYRFVLFDEEEEKPRLLIWLFKPSIRLAYTTPAQYIIPRSGSLHAAKTLWKILPPGTGPDDLPNILDKYPGFPQAEHLFYPMSVCRRLAAMLKESSGAYPESVRKMCGLDVGWLRRT